MWYSTYLRICPYINHYGWMNCNNSCLEGFASKSLLLLFHYSDTLHLIYKCKVTRTIIVLLLTAKNTPWIYYAGIDLKYIPLICSLKIAVAIFNNCPPSISFPLIFAHDWLLTEYTLKINSSIIFWNLKKSLSNTINLDVQNRHFHEYCFAKKRTWCSYCKMNGLNVSGQIQLEYIWYFHCYGQELSSSWKY